jgi:hypothetical protein
MQSTRQGLFFAIVLGGLLIGSVIISSAETINYTYDSLNPLIRVECGDGTVTVYIYDPVGNQIYVGPEDTTPPVTTASPAGGIYNTAQTVTLPCTDGTGSGCNKTYYTTDGSTPTTSSNVYVTPIAITSGTTTSNFFSTDMAGNSETMKTQTYTVSTNMVTVQL